MSDFIFTHDPQVIGLLAEPLKKIMPSPEDIDVKEYSGSWGALAVSQSPYNGFAPYETKDHICVVIGGPVLCWRDNGFLTDKTKSTNASQAILERWLLGFMDWSEDLSGPFVVVVIDKNINNFYCFTDLMMFIPVYEYQRGNEIVLGTHVDVVAKISRQSEAIDEVSIADFILHGIVTYPHTVYTEIFQLAPATMHKWIVQSHEFLKSREIYWEPLEKNPYKSIDDAANVLRLGLVDYIEQVTGSMHEVGQFISAGEDSRSIAGMLPERLKRHAYIYVDSKNREFNIAKRVSKAYGCEFHYVLRSPTHYLDILPVASKLVGSGQQYTHAHTLGLISYFEADKHSAVFGGYASDSLLKAMHIKRPKIFGKFPFLPDILIKGENRTRPIISNAFDKIILLGIDRRRKIHMDYIKKIRPTSFHEWFMLFPYSMREAMPNLSVNRRLFASYEIYTSNKVVHVASAVPTSWKINRKLFHKAVKFSYAKTKFIEHADGKYPYFNNLLNNFFVFVVWVKVSFKKIFFPNINDGPWANWRKISPSSIEDKELGSSSLINKKQIVLLLNDKL